MLFVEMLIIFTPGIDIGWNAPSELRDLRMNSIFARCLEPRKITVNNLCHGHAMTFCEFLYEPDLIRG